MTNKCKKRTNVPNVALSLSNKFNCLEAEDCYVDTHDEINNCAETKIEQRRMKRLNEKKEVRRNEKDNEKNTEEEMAWLDSNEEKEQDKETLRKTKLSKTPKHMLRKCKYCNFRRVSCQLDPQGCKINMPISFPPTRANSLRGRAVVAGRSRRFTAAARPRLFQNLGVNP